MTKLPQTKQFKQCHSELELPAELEIDEQRKFRSNRQRNRGKRTPFGFIREDRVNQQIPNMEEGED